MVDLRLRRGPFRRPFCIGACAESLELAGRVSHAESAPPTAVLGLWRICRVVDRFARIDQRAQFSGACRRRSSGAMLLRLRGGVLGDKTFPAVGARRRRASGNWVATLGLPNASRRIRVVRRRLRMGGGSADVVNRVAAKI